MELEQAGRVQLYGLEMEYLEFTPRSMPGKSTHPKFEDEKCYGVRFLNRTDGKSLFMAGLSLLKNYEAETHNVNYKGDLYRSSFNLLMGRGDMKDMIAKQLSEDEIYASWQPDLDAFKVIRQKYLLYPDF